jgi:hypothetical protein
MPLSVRPHPESLRIYLLEKTASAPGGSDGNAMVRWRGGAVPARSDPEDDAGVWLPA